MRPLLVIVCVLLVACGDASVSPSVVVGPSPTPLAPAAPITTTSPTPAGAPIKFDRVDMPVDMELAAVTALEDGFAAVGCRSTQGDSSPVGCSEGVVVTSANGHAWLEGEIEDAAGAQLQAVAGTPLGFVAVGQVTTNEPVASVVGAVWRSADGRRWDRIDVPDAGERTFVGITGLGERTIVVAGRSFVDGPRSVGLEAMATTDGRSWTRNSAMDNITVGQVVAAHPGLVGIGSQCIDTCGPLPENYVWRSVAGLGWSPDLDTSAFEGAAINRISAWGGAVVGAGTVGVDEGLRAATWMDADGTWRRQELPEGAGVRATEIVVTEQGLLVVGSATQPGVAPVTAWTSANGETWVPQAVDGLTGKDLRLAVRRDVVVAVADRTTIWVATVQASEAAAQRPGSQPSPVGADGCLRADPVTLHDTLLLDPADRLRCLGGRDLSFTAWVVPREGLGGTCAGRQPAWLAACDAPLELRPEPGPFDRLFPVFLDPQQSIPLDLGGRRVDVHGHFDDPRAAGCRSEEAADDPEAIRGAELVQRCRQSFVVTELRAVDG